MAAKRVSEVCAGRDNNFDFLRFACATLVVFAHSFPLLYGRSDATHPEWIAAFSRGQLFGGSLAVDGFFAMSGFLVTGSWFRSRGAADYLRKRALRIYPGFVVASLLGLLVFGALGAESAATYWTSIHPRHAALEIALLRPVTTPACLLHNPVAGAVNGSLWTIQYEFWCYLLVLALGLAGLLRRRAAVLALFAATYVGLLAQTYTHWLHLPAGNVPFLGSPQEWPRLLAFFLAGACAYLYADRIVVARRVCALCLLALALAARTTGVLGLLPLAGTYVLFYAAFAPGLRARSFGRRGDFSYGIYLYAFPVQQLLVYYRGARLGAYSLFAVAFTITLCLAVLSWRFVEEPFLRRKRARTDVAVVQQREVAGAGV